MGEAAHIYSASELGPRGQGGKDEDFLSSAANGIWCCVEHATLIDKKRGEDFPPEVLFRWKELAEARVRKQYHDIPSPLGWIHSIEFEEFANYSRPPRIELSRFTLLTGNEASGKSVLWQAAASVSNSIFAERFLDESSDCPYRFVAKIEYSTVDDHSKTVKVEFEGNRCLRYENGKQCLLAPGDIEVISLPSSPLQRDDEEDDLDFFKRILHLDRAELTALISSQALITMPGSIKLDQGTALDEDGDNESPRLKTNGKPYIELQYKSLGASAFIAYAGLSGSEQQRVVLGLLIAKAREVCKQRLTLLVLDDITTSLDKGNFKALLKSLAAEDFQVIVEVGVRADRGIDNSDSTKIKLFDLDHLKPWRIAVADARR